MSSERWLVHIRTGKRVKIEAETFNQYHVTDENGRSSYTLDKSVLKDNNWEFEKDLPKPIKQVGGDHYEKLDIQPWEVIRRANLDFWEGNVVKYVMRYRDKNGLEDLKKAQHYLQYLIDREGPA